MKGPGEARRFDGLIGSKYDLIPLVVPSFLELEESLALRINKEYSRPRVLDIGVGTGFTTKAILSANPDATVIGVDSDSGMLAQARSKLSEYLVSGQVELVHSNALAFFRGLGDRSCEVVASAYTLHNNTDVFRADLEREIVRVLSLDGLFINLDKYAADDKDEYLSELTDQIFRYDGLTSVADQELTRLWVRHELEDQMADRILWTGDALKRLRAVGFHDAKVVERIGQYAIVAAHRQARGMSMKTG